MKITAALLLLHQSAAAVPQIRDWMIDDAKLKLLLEDGQKGIFLAEYGLPAEGGKDLKHKSLKKHPISSITEPHLLRLGNQGKYLLVFQRRAAGSTEFEKLICYEIGKDRPRGSYEFKDGQPLPPLLTGDRRYFMIDRAAKGLELWSGDSAKLSKTLDPRGMVRQAGEDPAAWSLERVCSDQKTFHFRSSGASRLQTENLLLRSEGENPVASIVKDNHTVEVAVVNSTLFLLLRGRRAGTWKLFGAEDKMKEPIEFSARPRLHWDYRKRRPYLPEPDFPRGAGRMSSLDPISGEGVEYSFDFAGLNKAVAATE